MDMDWVMPFLIGWGSATLLATLVVGLREVKRNRKTTS